MIIINRLAKYVATGLATALTAYSLGCNEPSKTEYARKLMRDTGISHGVVSNGDTIWVGNPREAKYLFVPKTKLTK